MRERTRRYFELPEDYTVILGVGGATFLFDMVGLGLVKAKSLHYTCGEFSKKWYRAHSRIPWIEAQEVGVDYGQGITPTIPQDRGVDFVACTLNETSTGVMVDGLPEKVDSVLLGVDATSGAGQCPCDIQKTDVFFFSPQKVFASEGGLFVCILSPWALERVEEVSHLGRYIPQIMDWRDHLENSRKNQTATTSSLATLFLLNEQLGDMIDLGGCRKIQGMAHQKASHIYGWAQKKDYLCPYIKEERYRSLTTATIDVDTRYDVPKLLSFLEKRRMAYNIDSYRKLGRNQFRLALFPSITLENVRRLTGLLSHLLEETSLFQKN